MGNGRVSRPALAELGLNTGKKARLHRILYQHGLRNGRRAEFAHPLRAARVALGDSREELAQLVVFPIRRLRQIRRRIG